MTRGQWLRRSARHHLRRHVGTILGGTVATATLTASLVIGHSVRHSLERLARLRIGGAHIAVELAAPALLPSELDSAPGPFGESLVAQALVLEAVAVAPDRGRRSARVRALGVDEPFFRMAGGTPGVPPEGEVWLSRHTAARLEVSPGDELVLRVPAASMLPSDMPLGASPAAWKAARCAVGRIVPDEDGGRFDLRPSVEPPLNVFVNRQWLAALSGRAGVANLLLIGESAQPLTLDEVRSALASALGSSGRNLECRALPDGGAELRSASVFMDHITVDLVTNALPGGRPVLTYLINAWRTEHRWVPYSFAAGTHADPVVPELAADEVIVHEDLARDLAVQAGASLCAEYFILDAQQRLVETQAILRVRAVTSHPRDTSLVPDPPGISQASSCRDWKTPLPIDVSRIRRTDEEDWTRWRGAPKAWLRYETAATLWSNRFGVATAVRWPSPIAVDDIERAIRRLPVAARFTDLRDAARRAVAGGPDFTTLFLGLGGFLLVAALLLQAWLFGAALDSRRSEIRLLVALGFARREIARLLLTETAWVALPAALCGAAGGIALASTLLLGLQSAWQPATGGAPLVAAIPLVLPLLGAAIGWLVAMLAAGVVIQRRTAELPARAEAAPPSRRRVASGVLLAAALCAWVVAFAVPRWNPREGTDQPAVRLFAGGLSLLGAAFALESWFRAEPRRRRPSPAPFSPRRWRHHPRRTFAAIFVPACGWFVVFAVETHRPRTPETDARASPAGGFCAIVETALGLPDDPASPDGRRRWGLDELLNSPGVRILALRGVEGAAADCRNIQRVDRPPLLGVPSATFDELQAFRWRRRPSGGPSHRPWSVLAAPPGTADDVPAVLDASVATWGLGVRVGDRIAMTDERGRPFSLRIVGLLDDSIFQGYLLLDEQRLLERFPSAQRRTLLIEAPHPQRDRVRELLADRLEDWGVQWTSTRQRLDELLDVQRAYLDIFLAFSSLGLALGALGFGVVTWRSLVERRGELAMLLALGWRRRRLWRGAAAEHMLQAWAGLLLGIGAALIAFPPRAAGWAAWWRVSWIAAVALAAIGTLSVRIAVALVSRGPLLPHLRAE